MNSEKMNSEKLKYQTANILAYIAMITVNLLANIIPINGVTTGGVSAMYPNLFTPAPYTFAIWGLIYFLVGAFTIFQARDIFSPVKKDMTFLFRIKWLFAISCMGNIFWVFLWHYMLIPFTVIAIIVILVSLAIIYQRLFDCGKDIPLNQKFLVNSPFSVYLAWISVAVIANITVYLVDIGFKGFGLSPVFWTVLVTSLGLIITLIMLFYKNDAAFGLTIIWAYTGILVNTLKEDNPYFIAVFTSACIAVVFASVVLILLRKVSYVRLK